MEHKADKDYVAIIHSGSYLNTQKDLLLISKAEGRIITLRMTCYHVNRNKIF